MATDVAKPAVRPTTYAKFELITRLYLRPGLGHHRLDRLSVQAVQSFFNTRLLPGGSVTMEIYTSADGTSRRDAIDKLSQLPGRATT
jgi:Phage integrase, N-terminal SAM-like domain